LRYQPISGSQIAFNIATFSINTTVVSKLSQPLPFHQAQRHQNALETCASRPITNLGLFSAAATPILAILVPLQHESWQFQCHYQCLSSTS
jgi:hypothetical protein